MPTKCSDCGKVFNGSRCSCGFVAYRDEPITVKAKCGQPGCIYDARVRVYKNSGGYTDVCKPCYDKLFQAYAHNYCEQRGLKTRQDKIDFCKRMARSLNLKVAA